MRSYIHLRQKGLDENEMDVYSESPILLVNHQIAKSIYAHAEHCSGDEELLSEVFSSGVDYGEEG